jgi:hypothetical protein
MKPSELHSFVLHCYSSESADKLTIRDIAGKTHI